MCKFKTELIISNHHIKTNKPQTKTTSPLAVSPIVNYHNSTNYFLSHCTPTTQTNETPLFTRYVWILTYFYSLHFFQISLIHCLLSPNLCDFHLCSGFSRNQHCTAVRVNFWNVSRIIKLLLKTTQWLLITLTIKSNSFSWSLRLPNDSLPDLIIYFCLPGLILFAIQMFFPFQKYIKIIPTSGLSNYCSHFCYVCLLHLYIFWHITFTKCPFMTNFLNLPLCISHSS